MFKTMVRMMQQNGFRTIMIGLSLIVGIFTYATVVFTKASVDELIAFNHERAHHADTVLITSPFEKVEPIKGLAKINGVAAVEGRFVTRVRAELPGGKTQNIKLIAVKGKPDKELTNRFYVTQGKWPPQKGQIYLEQSSLFALDKQLQSQSIQLYIPGQKPVQATMSGRVYDYNQLPTKFRGLLYGYTSINNLSSLNLPERFNRVLVSFKGKAEDHQAALDKVKENLSNHGINIYRVKSEFPYLQIREDIVMSILTLLQIISAVVALFSGVFIANMVTGILNENMRHIGVLKVIGASRSQLVQSFILWSAGLSLAAFIPSILLALIISRELCRNIAKDVNWQVVNLSIPYEEMLFIGVLSVGLTMFMTLIPMIKYASVSIKQVFDNGIGSVNRLAPRSGRQFKPKRPMNKLLFGHLKQRRVRSCFTVLTIGLAGMLCVSVLNTHATMKWAVSEIADNWHYDTKVHFHRSYPLKQVKQALSQWDREVAMEGWIERGATLKRGEQENHVRLEALPGNTQFFQPTFVSGHWLSDSSSIVLTSGLKAQFPKVDIGEKLTIKLDGETKAFRLAGVIRSQMTGPTAYIQRSTYQKSFAKTGAVNQLFVKFKSGQAKNSELSSQLEQYLRKKGFEVMQVETLKDWLAKPRSIIGILTSFLSALVGLFTVISGLTLAGTLSLNVTERRFETSLLRLLGASNGKIIVLVLAETLILVGLGLLLGFGAAYPFGYWLSDYLGAILLNTNMNYQFGWENLMYLCGMASLLTVLSATLPIRKALRLPIQHTFQYKQ